jgi:hypothetical protein
MLKTIANRYAKRAAARRRAIRHRAAIWKQRVRRTLAIALILANGIGAPSQSFAQGVAGLGQGAVGMGQSAMAPGGGLLNGAAARLGNLSENGPGWLYYGVNGADRGLGYRGSYMTLGGFIPYAEDDLGGLWSADVRSHLSNYGGFFSNVGAVRKQFIGGTLLGVGVYWDYDGDQNQYADTTIVDDSGSYLFAGGQSYNQIGVSGEWLTDYGNLRSNGYIPVGTTATTMGPFVGNSLLCQYGINAALAGADLEVGAYVPGLSDWAGMVSVGGYAYGNSRYDLANGQDAVPWFGGVYTRLDLTLIKNWDFSLQYNNDSYFDSTGFARLTYRMGGSRRRNVPDQMEQPLMRNEHIVRAHQAPEQAINPFTQTPWRVIHVDNSTGDAPQGNGTAESPFTLLATDGTPAGTSLNANAAANQAYDIVFVHQGNSVNSPYAGGFVFNASDQYLVGEGTSLRVPTANCGFIPVSVNSKSSPYPVITGPKGTNPAIAAIELTNGSSTGAYVDHLKIVGAPIGISDGVGMAPPVNPGDAPGRATVNDVQIVGTGAAQTGVVIADAQGGGGRFEFTNMALSNLTADGFVVDGQASGASSGNPYVDISNSTIENTSGSAVIVNATSGEGRLRLSNSTIDGTTGPGVTVTGANAIVQSSTIRNVGTSGVQVSGGPVISGSTQTTGTSTVQVVNSTITAEIGVQGSAPNEGEVLNLTINQNRLSAPTGGNGINLAINGSGTAAGQSGAINANIVGNLISVRSTTAVATGTAGGIRNPISVRSDIYLTTSNTAAGLASLRIKAASQDNLTALNRDATVTTNPIFNPVNTGTTSPLVPPPPPPNYDPSLLVPLPSP